MFDLSENSCYLTVIRPPAKSVKHCTDGTCEIQRVSFLNNHTDLQYSIKHSKALASYKDKYPYINPFNQEQCEFLFKIKAITDEKSKFYVAKTLKELHCTIYAYHLVENLKKQKYNSKNTVHEAKLLQIWKNLKPKEQLQARVTDQWISIGFQVNDPATDFRGAGVLGLLNLHQFSSTPQGKKAFAVSSNPKTEYFFCSAGLFFTMLTASLLKQRKVQYSHWSHSSDQQLLHKFQQIYELLFLEFSTYWIEFCADKSILYFNQNLKNFEKIVKNWSPQAIRARLLDSKK